MGNQPVTSPMRWTLPIAVESSEFQRLTRPFAPTFASTKFAVARPEEKLRLEAPGRAVPVGHDVMYDLEAARTQVLQFLVSDGRELTAP